MGRKAFVLIAVIAAVMIPISACATQVEVLDNGMTLVVEENHSAPVASVRVYANVGSVYEGEYLGAGISHFIEHCVSEGTPTRTKEQIDSTTEALGNDSNAYTTDDHTCYYINTAAKYTKEAAELVLDYVLHATFPMKAVDTQRGIIQREIARGDDEPGRRIYHLFKSTVFTEHPARHRTIGYEKQFNNLQRADLMSFHSRTYVPENIICVAVGDFDATEMMAYLTDCVKGEPRKALRRQPLPAEPRQISPRESVVEDEGLRRAYMITGWPTVDLFSPDLYALDVAAYILGHGKSSRLVRDLRDEKGLVDSISVYSDTPSYGAGTFAIQAVMNPANIRPARESIAAHIERLTEEDVTAEELEKARNQKASEVIYRQETIQGRAEMLGIDMVAASDPDFTEKYIQGIRSVTAEEVREAANRYFTQDRLNTAVLRPPVAQEETETAEKTDEAAKRTVSTRRMENGMFVIVQEARHSPVVSMLAGFKGGVRYEPPEKNGLSNLTSQMLVRGTDSRSYEEISGQIDRMASNLAAFSGRNTYGLQAQCTRDNFQQTFDIFADCIRNPAFPEGELARQKELAKASIAARKDNVDARAMDLLAETFYKKHPYRMPVLGTEETVDTITREDLVGFHNRYARPNGMVLAIIGDIDAETAFEATRKQFGSFPVGEITPPAIPPEPEHTEQTERTIVRDQKQAVVIYGFPGPQLGSDDRYARDVMTAIFAGVGMPGGRLHRTLRGSQLVYATWGFAQPGIETGHYTIYAATASDKVDLVRQAIRGVIEKLTANGPTEDELQRGKKMAVAATQLDLQSNLARAQKIVLDELYGLGFDNYLQYADNIEKVTAQQVQDVASRLLDLSQSTVVVITPDKAGQEGR